jgi:hypothetical protein
MKRLFPVYLDLPILFLVTGTISSIVIVLFLQDSSYQLPIYDWVANFWYIGCSLIATEAVVRHIFLRDSKKLHIEIKNHHLQVIVRNLMLGVILIVCDWAPDLESINQALRYLTVRLGITLLLLGALVMFAAHRRMVSL